MVRQIEANHAILESLTYQMNVLSKDAASTALGGLTALPKVQATKTFEYCAREAAQIFGGASYVQGGLGEKGERMYRDVRAYAIPGGSEVRLLLACLCNVRRISVTFTQRNIVVRLVGMLGSALSPGNHDRLRCPARI